jgi:hypothetical protein
MRREGEKIDGAAIIGAERGGSYAHQSVSPSRQFLSDSRADFARARTAEADAKRVA